MNQTVMYVLIFANCLICGLISHFVANKRLMDGGFWWGFFLCEIGIIIVALRPSEMLTTEETSPQKLSEELEKAFDLKNKGILTEEEYKQMREKLLERI